MLSENGLDPVAVTQAFASGQEGLLNGVLQVKIAEMNNVADAKDKVEDARIEVAKQIAIRTGGALPVRTQLALENALESGTDVFAAGVPSETVHLWLKQRELSAGAQLRTAIATENPQAKLLEGLLKNMKDFTNLDQMGAANTVAAQLAAAVITEQEFGPRPGPDLPDQRAFWDERARANFAQLGIIGKRVDSFMGIGFLNPDETDVTQPPGWTVPQNAADTTGTASPGTPKPVTTDSTSPKFHAPDAANAVSAIIGMAKNPQFQRGAAAQTGPGGVPTRPTPLRPGVASAADSSWIQRATVQQAYEAIKNLPEAEQENQLRMMERIRGADFHDEVAGSFPAQ
jgi:hypothetical protein